MAKQKMPFLYKKYAATPSTSSVSIILGIAADRPTAFKKTLFYVKKMPHFLHLGLEITKVFLMGRYLYGHPFYHLKPVTF